MLLLSLKILACCEPVSSVNSVNLLCALNMSLETCQLMAISGISSGFIRFARRIQKDVQIHPLCLKEDFRNKAYHALIHLAAHNSFCAWRCVPATLTKQLDRSDMTVQKLVIQVWFLFTVRLQQHNVFINVILMAPKRNDLPHSSHRTCLLCQAWGDARLLFTLFYHGMPDTAARRQSTSCLQ